MDISGPKHTVHLSNFRSMSVTDYIHELNSAPKPGRAPVCSSVTGEKQYSRGYYSHNTGRDTSREANRNICRDIWQPSIVRYPSFDSES